MLNKLISCTSVQEVVAVEATMVISKMTVRIAGVHVMAKEEHVHNSVVKLDCVAVLDGMMLVAKKHQNLATIIVVQHLRKK